jgi:helicase
MTLQDLQHQYNIDPAIIRIWAERESETLLPIQAAAIWHHKILEGNDLLVSAPTSSGKTFLAEIAAIHTIYQRKKVIYLLPLKALAEEKYADFSDKYAEFGIDVVISTGDRTEFDGAIERGDFQLAVIVFEKANRLLVRNKNFIDNCGLMIVDEIQMTADYSRGSNLEMLLTAILSVHQKGLGGLGKPSRFQPQLIALSAVIGDMNKLDEWLGMDTLRSAERPVELQEGILRKDGTFTYRGFISKEIGTEQFPPFPTHLTFNLKSAEGKREYQYKRLQHYVSYFLSQGEQVLIFMKWKSLTRDLALRLARDLELPPALSALEAVHEMEDSISKEMLIESLRHGVAFHNADLDSNERRAIERYFREEHSKIRVLCATSTLAMGINLPVKTVIINDLEKPDPNSALFQEIPLSAAEYKNMSGRAGRLKRQDQGRSILFADTPAEEGILWRNYIEGVFPRIDSVLFGTRLLQETLFLIAAGICSSEKDVFDFMRRSYAGTLYWNHDAKATEAMKADVKAAITYCIEHDLVVPHSFSFASGEQKFPSREGQGVGKSTQEKTATYKPTPIPSQEGNNLFVGEKWGEWGELRATEIGRICGSQGVSVETFGTLMQLFAEVDPANCDPWDIVFIVTHNRELEELHFRLSQAAFESGEYWRAIQELNPGSWETLVRKSEEIFQNRFEVVKRMKMSLLLLDWMGGMSLQRLEIKYSQFYRDKSYSGAIRGLAENTGWMIRLLADVAAVRHQDQAVIHRLQTLAKMVLYGVPETGIELASLQVPGLTRPMIMRLAQAGYITEEYVLDAELEELGRVIPKEIAFRLQERLYRKYSRTETRHLVDQKLRLERMGYDSTSLKQVYTASTLQEFDEALIRLLRSPQIKLILQEVIESGYPPVPPSKGEYYGRDYLVERETGPLFVRILSPNLREISDEHFGNLLTLGMKYNPAEFILIGRPDFTEATYTKAKQFSTTYTKPLTLYPAYEICERYVRALEGDTEEREILRSANFNLPPTYSSGSTPNARN